MQLDRLNDLPAFLAVARHRGFTPAAQELGLSRSALSLAIRRLEKRLGVALFTRTTRSVGLTEAGERLLEQSQPLLRALDASLTEASELGRGPSGTLRLTAPRAAFAPALGPLLPTFARQAPHVVVEICLEDGLTDLALGGFDAGVRLGDQLEADMIAARLTDDIPWQVVASPAYLASRGEPKTLRALDAHDCIGYRLTSARGIAPWRFERTGEVVTMRVTGSLVVNDCGAKVDAARRGLGLAMDLATTFEADVHAGRLIPVLEAFQATSPGFFLYYPERHQVLPKLRAFVETVRRARGS